MIDILHNIDCNALIPQIRTCVHAINICKGIIGSMEYHRERSENS